MGCLRFAEALTPGSSQYFDAPGRDSDLDKLAYMFYWRAIDESVAAATCVSASEHVYRLWCLGGIDRVRRALE